MMSTWPHFSGFQRNRDWAQTCWTLGLLSTFPCFSKLNFGHRNILWELVLEWLNRPSIYWCSLSFCPPSLTALQEGWGFPAEYPSCIIGIWGLAADSKQWLRGREGSWIIFPATLNELQTAGEQPSCIPGNFNWVFCQKGAPKFVHPNAKAWEKPISELGEVATGFFLLFTWKPELYSKGMKF